MPHPGMYYARGNSPALSPTPTYSIPVGRAGYQMEPMWQLPTRHSSKSSHLATPRPHCPSELSRPPAHARSGARMLVVVEEGTATSTSEMLHSRKTWAAKSAAERSPLPPPPSTSGSGLMLTIPCLSGDLVRRLMGK